MGAQVKPGTAGVSLHRERKAGADIPDQRILNRMRSGIEEKKIMTEAEVRRVSPLTLAYVGDAVYELMIRSALVRRFDEPVRNLHRMATGFVKAETQSAMMHVFEEKSCLTEEEQAVFHRGRNAKANTHAKNANIQEYRRATGFEAVCGYLYLRGESSRLTELIEIGLEGIANPVHQMKKQSGRPTILESRNETGRLQEEEQDRK